MMRDIKFRAWDGKKMIYDIIPWHWDYVLSNRWWQCVENISESESEFRLSGFKYKEIMQFTGLLDTKGREIYEGDIVKFEYGEGGYHVGVIEYQKNGFWIKDMGYIPYECEVIGNIYENSMEGE